LNTANVGWTWWTYREHSAAGDGFAPYWSDGHQGWQSDLDWLACIDSQF
jgi:hypothetical protein